MLPPKIWIICRVCLKQQDKLYNIFENSFLTNIWYILRDCGGVPVRRNDNFPDKICDGCLKRLWEVYKFRNDCQRAHRDMVQKQLNWRAVICELELKNEMEKCTEASTVSNSTKASSSSTDDNSSSTSTTNESSNALSLKESLKSNDESINSQTSSISNKKITISSKLLNLNEINHEFKNNDETTIPKAEKEIHNPHMKQYCVITKKNVDEQTEKHEQKNIKEPIVLRLKVKNKESNENHPTMGYDSLKANNNNETTNQIAASKESNEINMNVNIKTDLSSNKSSKLSSSNEGKRNDCKLHCKTCKKKCKTFRDLRHHMYTHIKPHHCNICQKKFSQSHALLSHAHYHTGIKPFYCRICFKSFADISNRNCHERTFHIQKKFKCTKCNKMFRFQTLLNKHVRTHKPIKCMICDREFSSVHNVRYHHQRVHLKSLFIAKN